MVDTNRGKAPKDDRMKAEERRHLERQSGAWRRVLDILNRLGPRSDSRSELDAYGDAKDYVLDRIDHVEAQLAGVRP